MNKKREEIPSELDRDQLVSQAHMKVMMGGISDMTLWRWRKQGLVPEPISIHKRNYWRASDVLAVLKKLAGEE